MNKDRLSKVGSICYATSRGLGHLCYDFYKHDLIDEVFVIEHSSIPTNWGWYPNSYSGRLARFRKENVIDVTARGGVQGLHRVMDWVRQFDSMLFFETPFDWSLFDYCHNAGIRTYLVPMYECMPRNAPKPYKYLCPSLLDLDYFPEGRTGMRSEFLTLPVDYPWRLRERALHYVHNGGYLGVRGNREGTLTLIEAMEHVQSPLKLTIRCQENVPDEYIRKCERDPRITYVPQQVPYHELYSSGDVCVGAQRWNGCSLPLQEAFASGMAIINTNRYPMNTWLPNEGLVNPSRTFNSRISGAYIDIVECEVDPKDLAAKMDAMYGQDIRWLSQHGGAWSQENSWEMLKSKWLEALQS